MVGPGIGATHRHNLSYRIRRIRYRQETRIRLASKSYRHVALPPKTYRHNLSYRIRQIRHRQLSYRQKSTVNSHTAKKVRQYWIPPRKYRQHWIPPKKYRQYWIPLKRHRQYWIPPKRYRQHWIPPKRHRLFFLVFMFSSATPHSWFIFISSGYMCTVIRLRMYYILRMLLSSH